MITSALLIALIAQMVQSGGVPPEETDEILGGMLAGMPPRSAELLLRVTTARRGRPIFHPIVLEFLSKNDFLRTVATSCADYESMEASRCMKFAKLGLNPKVGNELCLHDAENLKDKGMKTDYIEEYNRLIDIGFKDDQLLDIQDVVCAKTIDGEQDLRRFEDLMQQEPTTYKLKLAGMKDNFYINRLMELNRDTDDVAKQVKALFEAGMTFQSYIVEVMKLNRDDVGKEVKALFEAGMTFEYHIVDLMKLNRDDVAKEVKALFEAGMTFETYIVEKIKQKAGLLLRAFKIC